MEFLYFIFLICYIVMICIDCQFMQKGISQVASEIEEVIYTSVEPSLLQCVQRCRFIDKTSAVDFKNKICKCQKLKKENLDIETTLTGIFITKKIKEDTDKRSLDTDNYLIVNGNWGDWSGFTCSKTCKNAGEGDGQQTRRRNCSNPVPQYGGLECLLTGSVTRNMTETEINGCMVIPPFCPINGNWGEWQGSYVICNNRGFRKPRYCNNPSPQHGGLACVGADHKCEW